MLLGIKIVLFPGFHFCQRLLRHYGVDQEPPVDRSGQAELDRGVPGTAGVVPLLCRIHLPPLKHRTDEENLSQRHGRVAHSGNHQRYTQRYASMMTKTF